MPTFEAITIDEMNNIQFIIEDYDEVDPKTFEKIQLSEADIYYKFRYTFSDDYPTLDHQKVCTRDIVKRLKPYFSSEYYTAGIEHFSEGMKDAKPHVHIHFVSRTKKDTIVKKLKRSTSDFEGNRCYSLKAEIIVDKEKFYRYPLKQQKGQTQRYAMAGGFGPNDTMMMKDVAYGCWLTASEIANKKIEKKEDADQLVDRLFVYLDKCGQLDTDTQIKIKIQQFYIEEEKKPFNKTTALGYFYNYKITRKKMTHEQLACLW